MNLSVSRTGLTCLRTDCRSTWPYVTGYSAGRIPNSDGFEPMSEELSGPGS